MDTFIAFDLHKHCTLGEFSGASGKSAGADASVRSPP